MAIIAGEEDKVDPLAVVKAHIHPAFRDPDTHVLKKKGHQSSIGLPASWWRFSESSQRPYSPGQASSPDRTWEEMERNSVRSVSCGWAWRPAKANENRRGWTEWRVGSGEIEISHGASEAEQLFDPERA